MKGQFFQIDNNIFNLKLDPYEFQIYCYLVSCAGSKGECWPSVNTMARMLQLSPNTISKKIDSLIDKHFLEKMGTTSKNKNGKVRTSNNHYFLLPFAEAWDHAFRFPPSA